MNVYRIGDRELMACRAHAWELLAEVAGLAFVRPGKGPCAFCGLPWWRRLFGRGLTLPELAAALLAVGVALIASGCRGHGKDEPDTGGPFDPPPHRPGTWRPIGRHVLQDGTEVIVLVR